MHPLCSARPCLLMQSRGAAYTMHTLRSRVPFWSRARASTYDCKLRQDLPRWPRPARVGSPRATLGKLQPDRGCACIVDDVVGGGTTFSDTANVEKQVVSGFIAHSNETGTAMAPDPTIGSILPDARQRRPTVARRSNRMPNGAGEWRCGACGIFMSKDHFNRLARANSGIQALCKVCARQTKYMWSCTLRGNMLTLLRHAKERAQTRGHGCSLTLQELLDIFCLQYGLCSYSAVPMSLEPNSDWRMSLERLSSSDGYTKENVTLIACEFNTFCASHSSNVSSGDEVGDARWSRQKVRQVPTLQKSNIDLHALGILIQEARKAVQRGGFKYGPPRQANDAGNWHCKACNGFKPLEEFYSSPAQAVSHRCRACSRAYRTQYRRTLRGNAVTLVNSATNSAKRRGHGCNLLREDVFDMLVAQGGRCYYSGVPMECIFPKSHWRMSLERINNDIGYTRENCVLIAQEFNTSDFSRNRNTVKVSGTAQWSRQKVQYVWGYCWPGRSEEL